MLNQRGVRRGPSWAPGRTVSDPSLLKAEQASEPHDNTPEVSASVPAQLLATEHWSLLASRSTTQGEVLTRISMFLTFTSASLLSVALVGQATRFTDPFLMFAITILSIDVVIGLMTQIRVLDVGNEDLMYVVAMNRLRAAYIDLDPGLAPYLMAGRYDDESGSQRTYDFFRNRATFSHVAGSSMVFIIAANSALIALLSGTVITVFGAPLALCMILGAIIGLAFFATSAVSGYRRYRAVWQTFTPISPTPPGED